MTMRYRWILFILFLSLGKLQAHPLRLSLCEIDYKTERQILSIRLKLFLTDVNEALVFDPSSNELAFCQDNESHSANPLLLKYLNDFFYVKINGEIIPLVIGSKKLSGEGENTALWVSFEHHQPTPIKTVEVKNAVFTDLFFDQNNIVYVHLGGESQSFMLNKKTAQHLLEF